MAEKILVVDDIVRNIQLLGAILGKKGYRVSYATNGKKALAMTADEQYDLILLDIMMPEMDGITVCKKLKESEQTRDIPVLFLTAKSEQDDIITGLEHGAADYLTKPFNSGELVARVRTHLHLRKIQQALLIKTQELEGKNLQLERLLAENKKAMAEIKTLRGILPICSSCKKIRNDEGYWTQIEAYILEHSDASFTHGICEECAQQLYPYLQRKKEEK